MSLVMQSVQQDSFQADPGTVFGTCDCRRLGGSGRPVHSLDWSSTLGSEVAWLPHLANNYNGQKRTKWKL